MDHMHLLRNAMRLDAKLEGCPVESLPNYTPKKELVKTSDDPFGGNVNNRKVAEKLAKNKKAIESKAKPAGKAEASKPEPKSEPAAPKPVQQVNPAPVTTVAPPVWKPNA